jgi:hypothetical protein
MNKKFEAFLVLYTLALFFSTQIHATDSGTPVPYQWGVFKKVDFKGKQQVIGEPWFTAEGQRRLLRSNHKNDFYQMAHHYQPQLNPVYAGIASAVIVMNALRVPKFQVKSQLESEIKKPKLLGTGIIPFPAYNQINFFTDKTDKAKDRKQIGLQNVTSENENDPEAIKPGTSLSELTALLNAHDIQAAKHEASTKPPEGVKQFRSELKRSLQDSETFILANFKGDDLGAATEGTVSPLAAYDSKTDSVLILDVTGHKNPWYWVPVEAFYASMHTQYGKGIWRGWLLVQDK